MPDTGRAEPPAPEPIPYASHAPSARRSRVVMVVALVAVAAAVAAGFLSWAMHRGAVRVQVNVTPPPGTPAPVPPPPTPAPLPPATIALPDPRPRLTIVQRGRRAIPGSSDRVRVEIGDVTGGRVDVAVSMDQGVELLPQRSMAPGEAARFDLGGQTFVLVVTRLRTHLMSDDYADVAVRRDEDPPFPEESTAAAAAAPTRPATAPGATTTPATTVPFPRQRG